MSWKDVGTPVTAQDVMKPHVYSNGAERISFRFTSVNSHKYFLMFTDSKIILFDGTANETVWAK